MSATGKTPTIFDFFNGIGPELPFAIALGSPLLGGKIV
jgi:hypothetical protein